MSATAPSPASPTVPEGLSDRAYVRYPDLDGRHVFITGGGSGIGAYFVHAFASQGARVSFVSLHADAGEALCAAVAATGAPRPVFTACDIRDAGALQAVIAARTAAAGPVSVLINNAARDQRHTVETLDVAGWDDLMATNLRPQFFSIQSVVTAMKAAGEGSILNVGSNSANLGLAGYPAYVTAKAAITGLTKALARELGPHGIRVNALVPGWVMTQKQKALWVTPEGLAECLEQQSLKRTIDGEDVAEAALFLASRAAGMITGQALLVDGGRAMP
jgi:NAD(P)-dependent dehydrogenase (short-subunit alcohol dehydrogenase family)